MRRLEGHQQHASARGGRPPRPEEHLMGKHRGGHPTDVVVDPDLGQATRASGRAEDARVGSVPANPTRHDGSQR